MEIIDQIKKIFIKFYGKEYEELIVKRLSSLEAIIFYDKKTNVISDTSSKKSYLQHYGITDMNNKIIAEEIPFSKYIIRNGFPGMMSWVEKGNLKTIIYFPRKDQSSINYDYVLIHELLHVLDEHIIIQDEDKVVTRGGFSTMTLVGDYEVEDYEWFNELIHQRISEEIMEYTINLQINLYNTKEERIIAKNKYLKDQNPVIEQFYQTFKQKLIEYKINGYLEKLINDLGKDNFLQFNSWLNKYYTKYSSPTIREIKFNDDEHQIMIGEGLSIVAKMRENINYFK